MASVGRRAGLALKRALHPFEFDPFHSVVVMEVTIMERTFAAGLALARSDWNESKQGLRKFKTQRMFPNIQIEEWFVNKMECHSVDHIFAGTIQWHKDCSHCTYRRFLFMQMVDRNS